MAAGDTGPTVTRGDNILSAPTVAFAPIDGPEESDEFVVERIPRRIIQTDKSRDLPLLARAAALNLRLLNPDFEYWFFDDVQVEQFIDDQFPQYRSIVERFPVRIQRYDLFRYLAVYRFGGFYFDTDMILATTLDDLLDFGCVFPFEHLSVNRFLSREYGMDWEIGNYAFGAAAGHPFLKAIIDNCVRAQQHPEWAEPMLKSIPRLFRSEEFVLATTGPGLVSRTLAEYPGAGEEVKVLFPENIDDRNSWHCFGTYGVHLQAGTWRRRQGVVRRVLRRNWESRTRSALLKESRKRGREKGTGVRFKSR
jgi:inositol phosphorylceramide mannosyltransferase catalytic subunit